jgi:hypothetical protein
MKRSKKLWAVQFAWKAQPEIWCTQKVMIGPFVGFDRCLKTREEARKIKRMIERDFGQTIAKTRVVFMETTGEWVPAR